MRYIILLIALVISGIGKACHISGGELTYKHLSGNNYEITLIMFEECECESTIEFVEINISSGCYNSQIVQLDFVQSSIVEISCSANPTLCDGSEYDGFHANERRVFKSTVNLPGSCSDYVFSYSVIDRIETDYTYDEVPFFIDAFLNNTNGHNSSPSFSNDPLLYACDNELFTYDNIVTEPDGDQLIYQIVCPRSSASTTLSYLSGQSCFQPLPMSGNISISSQGLISFTSNPLTTPKVSIMAIKVIEMRDGEIVGSVIRDMQVAVSDCDNELPLVGNPSSSSEGIITAGNIITVATGAEGCFSIHTVDPDADTGENMSVGVLSMPDFVTSSNFVNTDGSVDITFCIDSPLLCEGGSFDIKIKVSDGHCDIPGTIFANYSLVVAPTGYCPENRYFTNRNPTSGVPMPGYAKASNMIYVGDEMPIGSGIPAPQWGEVVYSQDVTLEAGVGIDLPACLLPGGDCVVLNGFNQTLVIKPNNCSPECLYDPIDVQVDKIFECELERVVPIVTEGVPPYSFTWTDGDGILLSTDSELDVHAFVSEVYWEEGFEYNLYIEDISGAFYTENDIVHGTKRFYEPVTNNVTFYDYPDDAGTFEDGYYYAGQPGVSTYAPFHISDSVNLSPPWYGATRMELTIWDRWDGGAGEIGEEINATLYYNLWDIEDTDDWSLDNAEVYWNGHWYNDLGNDCAGGPNQIWVYKLDARNCETPVHTELSGFTKLACYNGDWTEEIFVTKGAIMDSTELTSVEANRGENTPVTESIYTLYPNPTNGIITIGGDIEDLVGIFVYDITGNVVSVPGINAELDLGLLSSGIYTIELKTSNGIERKRILIQN